jgi:hypothetical protein
MALILGNFIVLCRTAALSGFGQNSPFIRSLLRILTMEILDGLATEKRQPPIADQVFFEPERVAMRLESRETFRLARFL